MRLPASCVCADLGDFDRYRLYRYDAGTRHQRAVENRLREAVRQDRARIHQPYFPLRPARKCRVSA